MVLLLLYSATPAFAQAPGEGSFELAVDSEQQVSLWADDASLEEIIIALGAEISAEVSGSLADDQRVTVQLANVSVGELLRQIGDSYVLISDAEDGVTRKIFLLGKGRDEQYVASPESGLPEDTGPDAQGGFQFEFDPATAPVREVETGQSDEGPEQR